MFSSFDRVQKQERNAQSCTHKYTYTHTHTRSHGVLTGNNKACTRVLKKTLPRQFDQDLFFRARGLT